MIVKNNFQWQGRRRQVYFVSSHFWMIDRSSEDNFNPARWPDRLQILTGKAKLNDTYNKYQHAPILHAMIAKLKFFFICSYCGYVR